MFSIASLPKTKICKLAKLYFSLTVLSICLLERAIAAPQVENNWRFVFPALVSVGQLVVLKPNVDLLDRHLTGGHNFDCRGEVLVPRNLELLFNANDSIVSRMNFFQQEPAKQLLAVSFTYTTLEDSQLKQLSGLRNLRYLDLDGAEVSDKGLMQLRSLSNLVYLNVAHTLTQAKFLSSCSTMTKLQYLDLQSNEITPSSLEVLTNFSQLKNLYLSRTGLDNNGMAVIAKLKALETLTVASNRRLDDTGLAKLKSLKKLKSIDVRDTSISARGLLVLKELPITGIKFDSSQCSLSELKILKQAFPHARLVRINRFESAPAEVLAPLH